MREVRTCICGRPQRVHSVNRVASAVNRIRLGYVIGVPLLLFLVGPPTVAVFAIAVSVLLVAVRVARRMPWRRIGRALHPLRPLSEPS